MDEVSLEHRGSAQPCPGCRQGNRGTRALSVGQGLQRSAPVGHTRVGVGGGHSAPQLTATPKALMRGQYAHLMVTP